MSEGVGTATLTALTIEKPLAGLFSISSYIPLRNKITEASFYISFYQPKYLKSLVSRSQLNLRRKSPYSAVTERKTVWLISSWKDQAKVFSGEPEIFFIDSEQLAWSRFAGEWNGWSPFLLL